MIKAGLPSIKSISSLPRGYSIDKRQLTKYKQGLEFDRQQRNFFYLAKTFWNTLVNKRTGTPFKPGNTEIRYTREHAWVKCAPTEGSVFCGITEQAKAIMRPKAQLYFEAKAGLYHRANSRIGYFEFGHPVDVNAGRPNPQPIIWPLLMPLYGKLEGVNERITTIDWSAYDPDHKDWFFCISGLHQWDWNTLLTKEEYLDFIESCETNVLNIRFPEPLEYKYPYKRRVPKKSQRDEEAEISDALTAIKAQHEFEAGPAKKKK